MKTLIWSAVVLVGAAPLVVLAQQQRDITIASKSINDRRIVKGRAVYFIDEIALKSNQTLVFDEPATLYVNRMSLEKDAAIQSPGRRLDVLVRDDFNSDGGVLDNTFDPIFESIDDSSGQDAPNGEEGFKASDALKGGAGGNGTNATNAGNGGDGEPITITTPYLRGNLTLISRGGNGGNGKSGGNGGNGGLGFSGSDARTLYYFKYLDMKDPLQMLQLGVMIGVPYVGQVLAILTIFNGLKIGDGFNGFDGGRGGNGGSGGSGGNGGNGGAIKVVYGIQIQGSKISSDTRGGRGGAAGRGGVAGVGGAGGEGGKRGDIWAREGKPGKSGLPGINGVEGKPGLPGRSGSIRISETNDPKWMTCYVEYRELLDLGEDAEFARDILRNCPK